MRRSTVHRATRIPSRFNAAQTFGAPYTPKFSPYTLVISVFRCVTHRTGARPALRRPDVDGANCQHPADRLDPETVTVGVDEHSWGRRARPRRKPKPPSRSRWHGAAPGFSRSSALSRSRSSDVKPGRRPSPRPGAPTYAPSQLSPSFSATERITANPSAARRRRPSAPPDRSPPGISPASCVLS